MTAMAAGTGRAITPAITTMAAVRIGATATVIAPRRRIGAPTRRSTAGTGRRRRIGVAGNGIRARPVQPGRASQTYGPTR